MISWLLGYVQDVPGHIFTTQYMTTADYRPTWSMWVYVVFHSEGLATQKYVLVTFYHGRKPFPDAESVCLEELRFHLLWVIWHQSCRHHKCEYSPHGNQTWWQKIRLTIVPADDSILPFPHGFGWKWDLLNIIPHSENWFGPWNNWKKVGLGNFSLSCPAAKGVPGSESRTRPRLVGCRQRLEKKNGGHQKFCPLRPVWAPMII